MIFNTCKKQTHCKTTLLHQSLRLIGIFFTPVIFLLRNITPNKFFCLFNKIFKSNAFFEIII
jgi:hypothetical protein